MELMLLVWVVENLTYNGVFFKEVTWCSFIVLCLMWTVKWSISVYNSTQEEYTKLVKEVPDLEAGCVFKVSTPSYGLEVGKEYKVTANFGERFWVNGFGTRDHKINEVRPKLVIKECYKTFKGRKIKLPYLPIKPAMYIIAVSLVLHTLLPSKQTALYGVGAYLLQTTFTSEFVQESMTLSQKAILQTLKSWSDDSPDLKEVLTNTLDTDIIGVVENVVKVKQNKTQEEK